MDRKTIRKVIKDIEQKGEIERKSKNSVLERLVKNFAFPIYTQFYFNPPTLQ